MHGIEVLRYSRCRQKYDGSTATNAMSYPIRPLLEYCLYHIQTVMPRASSSSPLRIAIVGAGLGGLAAAVSFRRQGHHVEVGNISQLFRCLICISHAYTDL
jgi:hypothetical protein